MARIESVLAVALETAWALGVATMAALPPSP
jgi:hypothetical protein